MTQEDKELLLKDLYARLAYNPLVEYEGEDYNVLGIAHGRLVLCKPLMSHTLNENPRIEEIKPYLFPLSSMTEEQRNEYHELLYNPKHGINIDYFDWCHKNHMDCRGLIPKGLAIDATIQKNVY